MVPLNNDSKSIKCKQKASDFSSGKRRWRIEECDGRNIQDTRNSIQDIGAAQQKVASIFISESQKVQVCHDAFSSDCSGKT